MQQETKALLLRDLVGEHILNCAARTDVRHPFYDDKSGIAFALDEDIYFVFEDLNDGYRSTAAPILKASGPSYEFWEPEYIQRRVLIRYVTKGEYDGEDDIIEVIDIGTGHLWMRVGTKNIDDYYPSFVAEWYPMDSEQKV